MSGHDHLSDNFTRANTAGLGAAWKSDLQSMPQIPQTADDPLVVEAFCDYCLASVGYIGLPPKRGASLVQVEFQCADCGHRTGWRQPN